MLNHIEELTLDGFQVVRAEMFLHLPRKGESTCTIWPTRISFSKQALITLNSCEFVRIEINPHKKTRIVSGGSRVRSRLQSEIWSQRTLVTYYTRLGD